MDVVAAKFWAGVKTKSSIFVALAKASIIISPYLLIWVEIIYLPTYRTTCYRAEETA